MKRKYESPTADIIGASEGDVIRTSNNRDYMGEWDQDW